MEFHLAATVYTPKSSSLCTLKWILAAPPSSALQCTTRQPYLGVTPPISTDPPSERHKQITETLMAQLRAMNQFESAEDARLR